MLHKQSIQPVASINGLINGVDSVVEFQNGVFAVGSKMSNSLRLINISNKEFKVQTGGHSLYGPENIVEVKGHSDPIYGSQKISEIGLLTWSQEELCIWDIASKKLIHKCKEHNAPISDVVFISETQLLTWSYTSLFKGKSDFNLYLLDISNSINKKIFTGHEDCINGVIKLTNGSILSWSDDKTIRIWSTSSSACKVLSGHEGPVVRVVELSNGFLASTSSDKTVRIWDITNNKSIKTFYGHTDTTIEVCDLPNNRILTRSTGSDTSLRLWDLSTNDCLSTFKYHTASFKVRALNVADLITWSDDGTICILDKIDMKCKHQLNAQCGAIFGILVLNSGYVVAWSDDNKIRVWDIANGNCIALLEGHSKMITNVILLSDGRLMSWAMDHTIFIWEVLCLKNCNNQNADNEIVGSTKKVNKLNWLKNLFGIN